MGVHFLIYLTLIFYFNEVIFIQIKRITSSNFKVDFSKISKTIQKEKKIQVEVDFGKCKQKSEIKIRCQEKKSYEILNFAKSQEALI